jgi:hypothetical protein
MMNWIFLARLNQQRGRAAQRRASARRYRARRIEFLEDRRMLATVNWIGGATGFWDIAQNWSTGTVPTAVDDVYFNTSGATVTIQSGDVEAVHSLYDETLGNTLAITGGSLNITEGSQVGYLNLSGGTLTVYAGASLYLAGGVWTGGTVNGSFGGGTQTVTLASGALTIGAAGATFGFVGAGFQWSGGAIAGYSANIGVTLTNLGTITLSGKGTTKSMYNDVTILNTGTIVDNGTVGDNGSSGSWQIGGGTSLYNLANGVVNMASSEAIDGAGVIYNDMNARFEGSSASGTSVNIPFNNQGGTIEVDAGSLTLAGGGTDTGETFNVASGATLDLTGGSSRTFYGSFSSTGDGTVSLASGTLMISSGGATFNFPAGTFQWSGGSIVGTGPINPVTLTNTGAITVAGNGIKSLGSDVIGSGVPGVTLNNSGTIVDDGSSGWYIGNDSVLNNLTGGLVNMASSEGIDSGVINNQAGANFESSGALGTLIEGVFNEQGGEIEVAAGSLNLLLAGGTDTGGTFSVASGATLNFEGGSNVSGTYSTSGGGSVDFNGGTTTLTGDTTLNGNFILDGATLSMNGSVALGGMLEWSSGSIEGYDPNNPVTLTNTGMILLTGAGDKYLYYGVTLANSGTIGDVGSGTWAIEDYAMLNNLAGGLVNMVSSENIELGYQASIDNEAGATFESGDPSGMSIDGPFNNAGGIIQVNAGSLSLDGGTDTGGTFNVAPGAALDFVDGSESDFSVVLYGTYNTSGDGSVDFSGGILTLSGGTTLNGNFNLDGATLSLNGPVALGGAFQWSSGYIQGNDPNNPVTLTNDGTIALTGNDNKSLESGVTFNNSGTILDDGTGNWVIYYATLNNLAGGVVNIASSEGIYVDAPGPIEAAINNEAGATFQSSGGSGTYIYGVAFNEQGGVVEVDTGASSLILDSGGTDTGGTFNVAAGTSVDFAGGTSYVSGVYSTSGDGSVDFSGGALMLTGDTTFNGNFNLDGATLSLNGNVSLGGSLNWSSGYIQGNDPNNPVTLTNTGTITLTSAGARSLEGGVTLANSGMISVLAGASLTASGDLTNDGTLTIGGALNVAGSYSQAPTATLDDQIEGTQSGQFGQMAVAASATLAGALWASFINGFEPAVGSTSTSFLTANAVSGTFSSIANATPDSGATVDADYSAPGAVGLVFSSPPGSALSMTTIQDPTNSSTLGQSVTFTATVNSVVAGSGTPTGSVTFDENGIPLPGGGTVALVNGAASFATSILTPGSDSITAVYSGDSDFAPSTAAADSHTVSIGTLTTVTWTGAGDGVFWNDPLNWSGDALPGPTDQVVINPAWPATIFYFAGTADAVYNITSPNSQVNLYLAGGSLSVLASSTIAGNVQNSAALIVAGGQLSLLGGATTGQFETAAGATVDFSDTNQVAGAITGAGNVVLEPNSDLTVDSIVQNSLSIGAGSTFTIAPSGSGSGNVESAASEADSAASTNPAVAARLAAIAARRQAEEAASLLAQGSSQTASTADTTSAPADSGSSAAPVVSSTATAEATIEVAPAEPTSAVSQTSSPASTVRQVAPLSTTTADTSTSIVAVPVIAIARQPVIPSQPVAVVVPNPVNHLLGAESLSASSAVAPLVPTSNNGATISGNESAGSSARESLLSQLFQEFGEATSDATTAPPVLSLTDFSWADTPVVGQAQASQNTSRTIFDALGLDSSGAASNGGRRASRSGGIVSDSLANDWSDEFLFAVSAFGGSSTESD